MTTTLATTVEQVEHTDTVEASCSVIGCRFWRHFNLRRGDNTDTLDFDVRAHVAAKGEPHTVTVAYETRRVEEYASQPIVAVTQ